jgi:hypothetical protein
MANAHSVTTFVVLLKQRRRDMPPASAVSPQAATLFPYEFRNGTSRNLG